MSLSICEAFVYTDQALPIERCPSFRDQPPGSTATYNGKCYIFYNMQPNNFQVSRIVDVLSHKNSLNIRRHEKRQTAKKKGEKLLVMVPFMNNIIEWSG